MRFFHLLRLCVATVAGVTVGLSVGATLAADDAPVSANDAEGVKFYTEQVEPLFAQHCYKCHGEGKNKGGLSLFTRESLLKGGDSGPAVTFENVDQSLLLDAINYGSYEMPPSGKLPAEQIEIITRWVKLGAPMPLREAKEIVEEHGSPKVNDETRNHWSFRKLVRPAVPTPDRADGVANPIDAFVQAKLEAAGLSSSPAADKRTLIRRVYYDLLGLPPTLEQVEAFAADDSPDAYAKLIDSLLESPHHGEHWARYWLDLVRYAESNSFERDNPKPYVWRYRDYVIDAFNNDKPYDQFVVEQLAGDEMPHVTREGIIATGYYRLGAWDDEPADPLLARFDELDDIIATTSQGFLGLTMNCARCHDHKLDPLSQGDYYKFLAYFNNIHRYGIRADETVRAWSVRSIASPEEETAFQAGKSAWERHVAQLRAELDATEAGLKAQLVGGEKDDFQDDSVRLGIVRKYIGKYLTQDEFDAYSQKRKTWAQLRATPPEEIDFALCVKEAGPQAPPTRVLVRGNPQVEGDEVAPTVPEILGGLTLEASPTADGASSGRRLALAKWIASPDNPLTARVMANRIWQWHFGRGIVKSSSNFGLQGDAPTHPELLDWLAAEFVDNDWSMKKLSRLILMSNTYCMTSAGNPAALEQDPENNLFWRFDMRRLRAEEIRDSLLAVNGTLKLDKMYGPSIYPTIPDAVLAGQSRPGENWHTSSPEEQHRRSIYIHLKRSLTVPLLASFDVAEADFTCPVRFATTQPTQALGMLNSEFLNEQARVFAEDVAQEHPGDIAEQIRLALSRTLQRLPTDTEIDKALKLIDSLKAEHGQSPQDALKNFCLVTLNLNEFVYLD